MDCVTYAPGSAWFHQSAPEWVSGLLRVYACCFPFWHVKGKGEPRVSQDMKQMLQSGLGWLQLDCRRFYVMLFVTNYLLLLQYSPIINLDWVFLSWLPAVQHKLKFGYCKALFFSIWPLLQKAKSQTPIPKQQTFAGIWGPGKSKWDIWLWALSWKAGTLGQMNCRILHCQTF